MRHHRVEHRLQRQVGLGLEQVDDRPAELLQRPDDLGPVLGRPGVAGAHHDYRLAMHVLGQEWEWRRGLELEDRRQLIGSDRGELTIEAQNLRGVFERVEDRPREHRRPHAVQAVFERGDDAEVPAAAAHTPEQIGVDTLARGHELAVGRDEIDREQVVDGGAVLAHQPADAPAERQAGDAGVGDDPAHGRQPEKLRLAVELAPEHAGLRPRRPRLRVDSDALHRREVDYQPPIADRVPADAVTTGTHRDQEIALARETHRRDHIGHARAAGDVGRTAVNSPIPDPAGSVVARARRQQ